MLLGKKISDMLKNISGTDEVDRLHDELNRLRGAERDAIDYVRRKVNQLLVVSGTLPLRHEELDDKTLLEVDPIGTIADYFAHILEHLNDTNEMLKTARDEIQAILSSVGVGILVVDDKMRIKAYNPKLKELFLKSSDIVIDQLCCEVLCSLDNPPPDCSFARVMASNISIQRHNWIYRDRHFDVTGTPIKNRLGKITHVVLAYHDITDRMRIEESFREREEMYRSLVDNSSDLVQSVGADGGLLYANHAWLEALGYREDDIFALTLHDIIHPEHLAACLGFFEELKKGKKAGRIETVFVGKDGSPCRVSGNISCSFSEGELITTCGIFRRLTA